MPKVSLTKKEAEQVREANERTESERIQLNARIASRKLLAEHQPVVFRMLEQALKQDQVPHACLFTGTAGSLKKEMAVLFAQSIILGAHELIDEEKLSGQDKEDARRIAEGTYGDLLYYDGSGSQAIDKNDVDDLQAAFAKTSMEERDRKLYILEHCENMTYGAMNSLLKFLEEPADNVYAILITDNRERVLPTIISRCVPVPFKPIDSSVYYELALQEGLDPEDAYFLSRITGKTGDYGAMAASPAYQRAKTMFRQWLGEEGNRAYLLVDYDVRMRVKPKDAGPGENVKDVNLALVQMFFGMIITYCEDILRGAEDGPPWYHKAVKHPRYADTAKILKIAVEERDLINRNNDLNLLMDQAIYRMEVLGK